MSRAIEIDVFGAAFGRLTAWIYCHDRINVLVEAKTKSQIKVFQLDSVVSLTVVEDNRTTNSNRCTGIKTWVEIDIY
jgi:hypothetical protein